MSSKWKTPCDTLIAGHKCVVNKTQQITLHGVHSTHKILHYMRVESLFVTHFSLTRSFSLRTHFVLLSFFNFYGHYCIIASTYFAKFKWPSFRLMPLPSCHMNIAFNYWIVNRYCMHLITFCIALQLNFYLVITEFIQMILYLMLHCGWI